MELNDAFVKAQSDVKTLTSAPSTDDLLELYALYKQGTSGDAKGKRPGMLDIKGRAKFDAWAKRKGMPNDDAKQKYIDVVTRLLA